jgi:C4-dicarboxylate-binding protein DctP
MKALAGLAATVCSIALIGAAPALAQQYTMKLSTPTVDDVTVEWMEHFKAGVEARTNGQIKVEIYPASQLGQLNATVEGVMLGTIEMETPGVGFLAGLDPRFQAFDAAGLFESVKQGECVLQNPEIKERIRTMGNAKGFEPLFVFLNGPLMLLSHDAIRSVDDFRGKKLRIPGSDPLHLDPFKALGASPVSMPLGEVLPAFQNHVIDGTAAAFVNLTAGKYYDIAKPATYLPGTYAIAAGIISEAFLQSIGPDLEKVIREEALKAEAVFSTDGVTAIDDIRKDWEAHGGETITLPPDQEQIYLDNVRKALEPILAADPAVKADYDAMSRVAATCPK